MNYRLAKIIRFLAMLCKCFGTNLIIFLRTRVRNMYVLAVLLCVFKALCDLGVLSVGQTDNGI